MNLENFSRKCTEELGDNLVGIHLLSPGPPQDRVPGFDSRAVSIVLMQCDKETLEKIKDIGKNFYRAETGWDILLCETVDELKKLSPFRKAVRLTSARTISGKGVAELIEMPPKKMLVQNLLGQVNYNRFMVRTFIASSGFWSGFLEKVRSYRTIKEILRLVSLFYFIRSGGYLTTRGQLREKGDSDVMLMCDLMDKYKYNSTTSPEIEKGLWASLSLLSRIENELKVELNSN